MNTDRFVSDSYKNYEPLRDVSLPLVSTAHLTISSFSADKKLRRRQCIRPVDKMVSLYYPACVVHFSYFSSSEFVLYFITRSVVCFTITVLSFVELCLQFIIIVVFLFFDVVSLLSLLSLNSARVSLFFLHLAVFWVFR